MTRTTRFIAVLVLTALMVLAFIGGSLTTAGSLNSPDQPAGQINLTPSQWAAVQAGNSLLTSKFSAVSLLPLIEK